MVGTGVGFSVFCSFDSLTVPRFRVPAFQFWLVLGFGVRCRAATFESHLVEVIPPELAVPGGRDNLGDPPAHLQHRDIESSAAEVEHQDQLVAALRTDGWMLQFVPTAMGWVH